MNDKTLIQPAITGYRQLSAIEAALMNEGKALGVQLGDFIARLRQLPATPPSGEPRVSPEGKPSIDQRWVSVGATQLQQGLMAVIRGIAQPSTF